MVEPWKEPRDLSTWGEIAEYLGVTVRTAQKWEAERGLPVRRLPGVKGRVLADRAELDRWREATLGKPAWWASLTVLRFYAVAVTGLLLLCAGLFAGLYIGGNRKGPPASFRHDLNTLIVTDSRGRELWRHVFQYAPPAGVSPESLLSRRQVWFGDLDGDGRAEMLYTYYPATPDEEGTTLFCFSESGTVKWRFTPGKEVRVAAGSTFPPPYLTEGFAVLGTAGRQGRKIAVTSHHLSFYPNQVALLSQDGRLLGEYWHSGHLSRVEAADLDRDGVEEILLAGVSNSYRSATLVILDPRELRGASTEDDVRFQIQGFGLAREKARILFPRTCLNQALEKYNVAKQLAVQEGLVQVGTIERLLPEADTGGVIYLFTRTLELKSVSFSDRLQAVHRELELAGVLDHRYSQREDETLRAQVRVLRGMGR